MSSNVRTVAVRQAYTVQEPFGLPNNLKRYSALIGNETHSSVGADDPLFRSKILSGQNATNIHSYNHTTLSIPSSTLSTSAYSTVTKQSYTEVISGSYRSTQTSLATLPIDSTVPYNQALINLYESLRDRTTTWESGVFLGELGKTLKMLRRPVPHFFQAIQSYIKRAKEAMERRIRGLKKRKGESYKQFQRRKDLLRQEAAKQTYLEATYGWAPLVSDIDSAMQALADLTTNNIAQNRTRARGRSSHEVSVSPTVAFGLRIGDFCAQQLTFKFTQTVGYEFVAGVDISGNFPPMSRPAIAGRLGLTLNNFAPTVYNLIPHSFIIDYFSNLGDVISAACTETKNVTWVSQSHRLEKVSSNHYATDHAAVSAIIATYPNFQLSYTGGSVTTYTKIKTGSRKRLAKVPFPAFMLQAPSFRHWFNLAALAAIHK